MTRFRKLEEIAHHYVIKKSAHGQARSALKEKRGKCITSIATENKYKNCVRIFLRWCTENEYSTTRVSTDRVHLFLKFSADRLRQKSLDGYRQALNLVFETEAQFVLSLVSTNLEHRAYTSEQILFLQSTSDEPLSLSILIAARAGLRAIELDTISRPDELSEDKRDWSNDRFFGFTNSKEFVVIGKGGLRRKVQVPDELAESLECRRLPKPQVVTQRGIHYTKRYGIIGGHKFSQQFSRLSKREFGWSNGAHGLRHSYAQDRMLYLQLHGFTWNAALEVVSQELGHFSTANTLAYMR